MFGQVLLHSLPFLPQRLGLIVEAHVLGCVVVHCEKMIADAGAELVQFGQALLEVLIPVMPDATDPAQLFGHELVQRRIVGQAFEIGPDQPDDVLFNDIRRNGVTLGASHFVATVMRSAHIVTVAIALAAGCGLYDHLPTTHAALAQTDQQVVGMNGLAADLLVSGPGVLPALLDSLECVGVNDRRPGIVGDDPIRFGAILKPFIVPIHAGPVDNTVEFAFRPLVVNALAQVGRAFENDVDRRDAECPAERGAEPGFVQRVTDTPRWNARRVVGKHLLDRPHPAIFRRNQRTLLMRLFAITQPLGHSFNHPTIASVNHTQRPIILQSQDAIRLTIGIENQPVIAKRNRTTRPQAPLDLGDDAACGVAGQTPQVIAVLVILDEADQTGRERAIRFAAVADVHQPLAAGDQSTFQQHAIYRVFRT